MTADCDPVLGEFDPRRAPRYTLVVQWTEREFPKFDAASSILAEGAEPDSEGLLNPASTSSCR